ncbi:uncharacterized protein LOC133466389 isoform X2 [Phyllopteryx taeniolatus]|uniref:uncharacterized protein LOC133466389 isoform X2 n=1 Tax=Phyllopteryx taeniolatus TaxID=161469 RepID=UPI002AD51808|nr:uncharacterized protein LOC133466389 isoform X2 [Phyllopteryx taeniolatus]
MVLPLWTEGTNTFSQLKAGPVPSPRSRINNKFESMDTVKNNYPADYTNQCPVRSPPEPPKYFYVDAIHRKIAVNNPTSITEESIKLPALYHRELPPPPPPRPPLANINKRQTSAQRKFELRPLPTICGLPPGSSVMSPTEPLYIELEEPRYLEILPSENDITFQVQGTSRPRRGINNQIDFNANMDIQELVKWMRKLSKTAQIPPTLYGLSTEEEIRSLHQRTMNTTQVLRLFNVLMIQRSQHLRDYIFEFCSISELLEKADKNVKSMGIVGGTTGAVGGVAAVVGIALAPATMGASLVVAAVGVGMVGAAGGMGVRASKPNKKIEDRKIIEKLVNDYMLDVADIERCLNVILSELKELQRHDLVRLHQAGALPETLKVAQKLQSVINNITNGRNNVYRSGTSSVLLLNAFVTEMDQYFKEKGRKKKLKKSNKSKLSARIQLLARNLQEELDYVNFVWKCAVI